MRSGRGKGSVTEKAAEVKEQAKELADTGGEAVREFMQYAAPAAREFASTMTKAARELVEATEKGVEHAQRKTKQRKGGRKLFALTIAAGSIAAVLMKSMFGRAGRKQEQWSPQAPYTPTPNEAVRTGS